MATFGAKTSFRQFPLPATVIILQRDLHDWPQVYPQRTCFQALYAYNSAHKRLRSLTTQAHYSLSVSMS